MFCGLLPLMVKNQVAAKIGAAMQAECLRLRKSDFFEIMLCNSDPMLAVVYFCS
jgi:hypothetical protein